MDIKDTVIETLAGILGKTPDEMREIDIREPLRQYGLESLSFIRFVVEIEEKLEIEVSENDLDMEKFATLEKTYAMLKECINTDEKPDNSIVKCIIADCDNTLWSGIAADDGYENLVIDGTYAKLQKLLVEAYNKGILLALCSKNDEKTVDDVFALRSDMIVKPEHIVTRRINWGEKHENIADIARELNIGVDSIIYIDDSKRELFWITQQLPDVRTVLFGEDSLDDIERVISNTSTALTDRNQLYRQEIDRQASKKTYNSVTDYYASLRTALTFRKADRADAERLVELSQRTNQFNLNATRYTEEDIYGMIENSGYDIITLTADDIFGTLGLCAFCVVRYEGNTATVEGFMMSCRVFGRYFEDIFLAQIKKAVRSRDCQRLIGLYTPTVQNTRFKDFYSSLELSDNESLPLEYFSEVVWVE